MASTVATHTIRQWPFEVSKEEQLPAFIGEGNESPRGLLNKACQMLGMLQCPGEGWVLPVWVESGVPNASSPYLNLRLSEAP